MSQTILAPVESRNHSTADDIDHIFCCDENRGLCGTDLTDVPLAEIKDDRLCVVCGDLEPIPCERCGS